MTFFSSPFYPMQKCLRGLRELPPERFGDEEYRRVTTELEEIQDRQYYNVRLVCNRLHGLRDHAEKHIQHPAS
jgi:hypothetical protein